MYDQLGCAIDVRYVIFLLILYVHRYSMLCTVCYTVLPLLDIDWEGTPAND